ncbi:MAG: histidinol-phosphatase [Lachnospiraceae bacterium]|nr:histidinol-phosphatase [Lachnospiraceae bacterium]
MIQTNLHNHTFRCHHATGTDEEYIIQAIQAGYKEIGFSDHCPFSPYEGCKQSSYRVYLEDSVDYFRSLNNLREKYKDQIQIHIGFEMEYYPEYFESMLKLVKDQGAEYLVLGQHFLSSDVDHGYYSGVATNDVEKLEKYCDMAVAGLETGVFTYLAHPDLFHFTGDEKTYEEIMRKMIQKIIALDYPLEFNRLGFYEKRNYPKESFWRIAGEEKARCLIGLDAHQPEVYADTNTIAEIENYLKGFGLTPEKSVVKPL